MDSCMVYYTTWQMMCCGSGFRVGKEVRWLVYPCREEDAPTGLAPVDYCYEAHDSDWKKLLMLQGRVERIDLLYRRTDSQKAWPEDAPEEVLTPAPYDDAYYESRDALGREAVAYLVEISGCTTRPARPEEVTYQD